MEREIDTIIFDFDGTLAPQTNRLHYDTFLTVFRKYGYKASEKEIADLFGVPSEDIVRRLARGADENMIHKIAREKKSLYAELTRNEKMPTSTIHTIEILKRRGFKIGIGSGSYVTPIKYMLPRHLIPHLITAEMIHKPKPDPEILFKICKLLRSDPHRCVYVGDSWRDREAARHAEMYFIGIEADLTTERLIQHEPELLIGRIPELLKIFKSCPTAIESRLV